MKYIATVDGRDFQIDIDGADEVVVDEQARAVDLRPIYGTHLYSLIVDQRSYELFVERRPGSYAVMIEGDLYEVTVEDARLKRLKAMGGQQQPERGVDTVTAPMPGLVVRVLVEPGDRVAESQGLVILEAMKMENEIRSPRAGVVQSLGVAPGRTVNLGDVLAVVGAAD
jgi:biotin carboxyl carrier protein